MDSSRDFKDDNRRTMHSSLSAAEAENHKRDNEEKDMAADNENVQSESVVAGEEIQGSCGESPSNIVEEVVDTILDGDETVDLDQKSSNRSSLYPITIDLPRNGSSNTSTSVSRHEGPVHDETHTESESLSADKLENATSQNDNGKIHILSRNSNASESKSDDEAAGSKRQHAGHESPTCSKAHNSDAQLARRHKGKKGTSSVLSKVPDQKKKKQISGNRDSKASTIEQSDSMSSAATSPTTSTTSSGDVVEVQPQLHRNRTEASAANMSVPGALAMPGRLVSELNSYEYMTRPTTFQRARRSSGDGTVSRLITQLPAFLHSRPTLTTSLVDDDDDDAAPTHNGRLHHSTMERMLPVFEAELVESAADLDSDNATRRSFRGIEDNNIRVEGLRRTTNSSTHQGTSESINEEGSNPIPTELGRSRESGGTTSSNSYEDSSQDGGRLPASRRPLSSSAHRNELGRRQSRSDEDERGINPRPPSISNVQANEGEGEECCAIDVQIEPDPVPFFCWKFEGSNTCFTRRIPLVYAISVFCIWTALSVILLGLIASKSNRKINEFLANQSMHGEMGTTGLTGNETLFLSGPGGSEALSRLNAISSVLSDAVASPWVFADENDVRTQTLRWLAYEDPQALHFDTHKKELVQRFSARVIVLSLLNVEILERRSRWSFQDEEHECNWTLTKDSSNPSQSDLDASSVLDDAQLSYYYEFLEGSDDHAFTNDASIVEENTTTSSEEGHQTADRLENPDPLLWSFSSLGEQNEQRSEPFLSLACNSHREVIGISIAGVFISSTLPHEISNLLMLESLSIRRASYATSSLPSYRPPSLMTPLVKLGNLTKLELEVDDFSSIEGISDLRQIESLSLYVGGSDKENALVPEEIGRLWDLKHLHLYQVGVVPDEPLLPKGFLLSMSVLETFGIHGCRFVERRNGGPGPGPGTASDENEGKSNPGVFDLTRYVGSIQNMQNFSIVECERKVTVPFPSSVGSFPKLRHLALPGVIALNSSIPVEDDFWRKLGSLVHLDLQMNKLQGEISSTAIAYLTNLETLKLGGNNLEGRIPEEFSSHFKNLRYLDLSSNKLTGDVPEINRDNLSTMLLQENMLTGPVFGGLCGSSNLKVLSLGGNNFAKLNEECAERLKNLEVVSLSSNEINTTIPSALCDMEQLKALQISDAGMKGSIPTCFGQLRQLRALDLKRNELSGSIPAELGSLPNLSALELTKNHLSGSLPLTLCRATYLKKLLLAANNISSTIPVCIGELNHLCFLLLDNNMFTGSIPPRIGNLKSLKRVDIGANMLSSSIPTEIGQMSSLNGLILGKNMLTGEIPHSIGSLSKLTTLDLGFNELEGLVPPSFGELDNLVKLSLVKNKNLTGNLDDFCSTRAVFRDEGDSDGESSIKDVVGASKRDFLSSSSSSDYNTRRGRRHIRRRLGSKKGKKGTNGLKQIPMYFVDEGVSCSCCLPIDFPCPFAQSDCDWLSYRPEDLNKPRPMAGGPPGPKPGRPNGGRPPGPYGSSETLDGFRTQNNDTTSTSMPITNGAQSYIGSQLSFSARRSRIYPP